MESVTVKDLRREYRVDGKPNPVVAINGISFSVERGEVFSLLGPNGAGKTTAMRILTTLLLPTNGEARVLGMDVNRQAPKIRARINFVFGGERGLYERLTATEYLQYFANLYWLEGAVQQTRIPELLRLVGLSDVADRKIETFSKGMKQRLHLARALINKPEVLFLDEPSIGLDPTAAQMLRTVILDVAHRGTTVLLTTHYMQEAERVSDRVALLSNGRIRAIGTVDELKRSFGYSRILELTVRGAADHVQSTLDPDGPFALLGAQQSGETVHLQVGVRNAATSSAQLLQNLGDRSLVKMQEREVSLEDVYLKAVGK